MIRFSSPRRSRKPRKPELPAVIPPPPPIPPGLGPDVLDPDGNTVFLPPGARTGGGGRQPPSSSSMPKGQRRRRVTLPRVTRGWSRAIVWSLVGISTLAVVYGFVARIETSVSAVGQLRPKGGVGSVSTPFSGIVAEVLVKEGQLVRKDQALIRLRDLAAQEQLNDLLAIQSLWRQETQVIATQLGFRPAPGDPASIAQLMANQREVSIRQQAASTELARSQTEMDARMSDVRGLETQLQINLAITNRMEPLVSQGAVSQLDYDRQKERLESVRTTLMRARDELSSARLRVRETDLKGSHIPAEELKQLYPRYSNARQQYLEVASKIADQRQRINLQTLRAPTEGKVFDLQAKAGETIGPAKPALRVVPQTALEARIEVSNKDIGFIKPGMKVDLRFNSFPSTEYGSIKAWITRVGADALPPDPLNPTERFVINAKLSQQDLKRKGKIYKLRPGMSFSALIILDSRPAISLVTDRLLSFMESSRTIR